MIKRATTVMMLTVFTLVVTASVALAQTSSTSYPIKPSASTSVEGAGGSGGTAFTGSSQVPVGTLTVVTLVVIGLAALFVARRRAARFAG